MYLKISEGADALVNSQKKSIHYAYVQAMWRKINELILSKNFDMKNLVS